MPLRASSEGQFGWSILVGDHWEHCLEAGSSLGWDWSEYGNGVTYLSSIPKSVNCGYTESILENDNTNECKASVLHPVYSTYAQEHPDFDSFILLNEESTFSKLS